MKHGATYGSGDKSVNLMLSPSTPTTCCGASIEKLHPLAIKMIPITEAQLKDAQVLAGD